MILAVAACRSSAKPTPAPVTPDPATVAPPAPELDPTPPIRGLEPALIDLLGLERKGAPAVIDPAVTARLATLSSRHDPGREALIGELTIYGFARGELVTEHVIELPAGESAGVKSWAWRTEDELVLLLDDGSLRTVSVRGGALAPLARPNKKLFAVPKPRGGGTRFDRDEGLIATAGEVWLHHCVWGEAGDDDPCTTDVYVQVAPKAKAAKTAPVPRAPWAGDPVPGWTLAVDIEGEQTTGVLHCKGPDGVSADLPIPEGTFGYSAEDAVWLSARPPIRLVKLWSGGMDGAVSVDRFLAGCATSDAEPVRVEVGPSGFWTLGTRDETDATNDGGALLLWHGRVVGTLSRATQILFAP